MTTLIIEDGTGIPGANSFFSAASAGSYFNGRSDTWTNASTADQEDALFTAGQYLNSLSWKGRKRQRDFTMSWPRIEVYDNDDYLWDYDVIPQNVKYAQAEAANYSLEGFDLFQTIKPEDRLKRKKIDVLEKEYFKSAYSKQGTYFSKIKGLLMGFIIKSGTITRS